MSSDEGMTNLECSEGGFSNLPKRSKLEQAHHNFVIQICFVIRHSDFVILHIRGIRGSSCKLLFASWLSALSENPFCIISGLLTTGSTFQPFNRRRAVPEMRKGAQSFCARRKYRMALF